MPDISNLLDDGFDVVAAPTGMATSARAAGNILGGLLTWSVARANDAKVVITGVEVAFKSAVTPSLTLVLFSADPAATTKTDNAAYSLAAADAFKVIKAIKFSDYVANWVSHGTPKSIDVDNLGIVAAPVSGAKTIFGLLIDGSGVTITAADLQVRLRGSQI